MKVKPMRQSKLSRRHCYWGLMSRTKTVTGSGTIALPEFDAAYSVIGLKEERAVVVVSMGRVAAQTSATNIADQGKYPPRAIALPKFPTTALLATK